MIYINFINTVNMDLIVDFKNILELAEQPKYHFVKKAINLISSLMHSSRYSFYVSDISIYISVLMEEKMLL